MHQMSPRQSGSDNLKMNTEGGTKNRVTEDTNGYYVHANRLTVLAWEKRVIVGWRNKRQAFPLTCQDKSGNPIRFQIPIYEMCPSRPLALPTLFDPSPMHIFLQPKRMMGCGLRGSEPEFLHRVDYIRRPQRECVCL